MERISLALYSFGMDSALTMEQKLRTAAEIGYHGVEFAGGFGGLDAAGINRILRETGLVAHSAHVRFDDMDAQLPMLAEIGVAMCIVPMHAFATKEETLAFAEQLNEKGRETAKHGIRIGYHNHTGEFFVDEGKPLMDWLIEGTDPSLVGFELDCGWASAAGADPVAYLRQHAGRFMAIHIKENAKVIGPDKPFSAKEPMPSFKMDEHGKPIIPEAFLAKMQERRSLNVKAGTGIVDWKAVIGTAESVGATVRIVERESSYNEPQDRVACLREDFAYLSAL
jgi:sugar phosphate isomerase/epimerase